MITPWAQQEMADVDFGDERLNWRAILLLSRLGDRPNLSIPAACMGRPEIKAAYRFFDNEKVTFEKILDPHIKASLQRVAAFKLVLLIQDTTEIDLTRPETVVDGVGELDGSRRGILLHDLQAYTPDATPLGTVWASIINRTNGVSHAPEPEKNKKRKSLPIEDKESMRWLEGFEQACDIAESMPETQFICIADSEADIYELFEAAEGPWPFDWVIRACQNRALVDSENLLREQVMTNNVLYEVEVKVRSRQAKTEAEDRARRQNRDARQVTVEVRAATVTLRPPWRSDRQLNRVTINVVLVLEKNPPAGETPIEWILLTTLAIDTPEQVRVVVEHYCVRWSIEILFRTLKSGCRVEERRFEKVDRILPCLAMFLVVSWRLLFVCRLGRECPDINCEVVFEPCEWKAVWAVIHGKEPPCKPPTLREMVHLVASLGGYIPQANNEPGTQTLWIGMQRMYDLAWAWETFGPGSKGFPNQVGSIPAPKGPKPSQPGSQAA